MVNGDVQMGQKETVHLYFVVDLFKIFEDMVKLANLVSLYSL